MYDWTNIMGTMGWGPYAALFGALLFVGILFAIALYVYFALAWYTIAKKLKHKSPWLAWIPFANIAMILQLGGFGWGWVFLILIPILGWIALCVLMVISQWRIFEKRKYPGWLSLTMILNWIPAIGGIFWLAYLVIIGLVAWNDRR